MRIVQTSLLSPWDPRHGGGQLSVHDLATALVDRGHDLDVIYSGSGDAAPADLAYRARFVPHHEKLYLNPPEYVRALRSLEGPIDVLHVHGYEGAFLAGKVSGETLRVATSRNPDPVDLRSPPPWTRPLRRLGWTRERLPALLERRALKGANLLLCVSEYSLRVLRERYGLGSELPGAVAHNGGRPPEDAALPEERLDLLCVARLDHHKGLDVLFRALTSMRSTAVTVDLVGDGWIESELKALASSLDIEDRVRFHGYQPPSRVAAMHRSARVLVLPSRSENFPRVILDGLHAGNAIVATRVGGIPEAVRDGREAILVPPDDVEALASALDRVMGDDALVARLSEGALERSGEFTWARAAERTEAAYMKALHV